MLQISAPAKINLYLHITGRRNDGYHLLDSLAVFSNIGDVLKLEPAGEFSFHLEGPKQEVLAEEKENLVVKAANLMAMEFNRKLKFKLTLVKNLPIASGLGGGSSDAAATIKIIAEYWGIPNTDKTLFYIAEKVGQDVPCCLYRNSCYFRGTGAEFDPAPIIPHTDIVLVNPNKELSTPLVFKEYRTMRLPFSIPDRLKTSPKTSIELARMLHERSNDLTIVASKILPDIKEVLDEISASKDCQLARMSGSGATCFGIFPNRSSARKAAAEIYEKHPDWWVVPGYFPMKNSQNYM